VIRAEDISLNFEKLNGLLPAVVQHHQTGQVLMVGFMNREAWQMTLAKGQVTFWSRERRALWTKGETSGNVLTVKRIYADCDADTILIAADPAGPTCHTGSQSCFFQEVALMSGVAEVGRD